MRKREEEKSWRVKLDDVRDWQLHWCVDKARLRCSFSFFSYSHSLGKKREAEQEDISLSLSSLCVFVYPPASSGFVLFNGCLFSHLYRYTYVYVCTVYYTVFVQWVIFCLVCAQSIFVRMKSYERDRQFRITRQTKRFLFSLIWRSLCSSYPTRIRWHLVLFGLYIIYRWCVYSYSYHTFEHIFLFFFFILSNIIWIW